MAKRRRLSPALISGAENPSLTGETETIRHRPPIAQVAGEAAEQSAFAEVAGALASARAEGRLIQRLPLAAIETGHLVRDRIAFDAEDMSALKESLRARGQQVPIEVVALDEDGTEGRFGLISGLRRVIALGEIGEAEILALVRRPDSSAAAYLAMVEENEIRAGISFYERARLAAEAARLGLYGSPQLAISALFQQSSPAKRSKIGSFVSVHDALGDALRFPAAIPERLGLALAKALNELAGFEGRVRTSLDLAGPETAEAERAVLEAALKPSRSSAARRGEQVAPGIRLEARKGRVVLSGKGVTEGLRRDLTAWLRDQDGMRG